MWIHYTDKKALKEIKDKGFIIQNTYGRFGQGIYFFNSEEQSCFGDCKIKVEITEPILRLTHKEICKEIFPEYDLILDMEGIPELKNYVVANKFKAASVRYSDGLEELIVYDENVIKII